MARSQSQPRQNWNLFFNEKRSGQLIFFIIFPSLHNLQSEKISFCHIAKKLPNLCCHLKGCHFVLKEMKNLTRRYITSHASFTANAYVAFSSIWRFLYQRDVFNEAISANRQNSLSTFLFEKSWSSALLKNLEYFSDFCEVMSLQFLVFIHRNIELMHVVLYKLYYKYSTIERPV